MKFPYGISDFKKIIEQNLFYVDRTDRIPLLEEAGYQLLFLRPRRFGKSLLLNMLSNYYNVANADEFETLFGHLAIGKKPTEKHNQYLVMTWDFSSVLPMGSTNELKDALYRYLNVVMEDFATIYQAQLKQPIKMYDDAAASFWSLINAVKASNHKLYLFIDEYDNFANEVMASKVHNNDRYADLVYGEGILKSLFKNVKAAAAGNGLDRVFITGVSPVIMADISSGYNVATNIYRYPRFNDLCGFNEAEIKQALHQVANDCQQNGELVDIEAAMKTMRQFYNGYCFNQHDLTSVYNPTLALYFLKNLQEECRYPDDLLDHNLGMDRDRINYIAQLPNGPALIQRICDDSQQVIVPKLHDRFGVKDMLEQEQTQNELASLLYYLGVLTQDKVVDLGELQLRVPNLVIRSLYVEKLRKLLLPDVQLDDYRQAKNNFFKTGDLQPLCEFIQERLNIFSNRDYRWVNEFAIKTAFMMLLFDDRLYIVDSEPELKRQYADFTLIARPDMRKYEMLDHLMEFKFVKLSDVNLSGKEVQNLSEKALQELPQVQAAFTAAFAQLETYQPILFERYGEEVLHLQTTAVVAVGFERLLWRKWESE
ncbi:AAA family ATPase [Thioflexithrix psekupsensis]|uniref:AAA-ATPase-like domain-containing protein n=1 Tax=Thioflexithrix psekupsensis TaxID=1570016 RepID=A0A251X6S0_9GAMM|nr:AAA family ATPase [Thioflexithrix psekupsensis]OUD13353.1 hypothetical protein TPSD3_10805 [Thioflexithrix psekupsensis]